MLNDIRFAIRTLLKSPGFMLTAVLALALGSGANTAIFSVIDAVLLRPLPFPEPSRLIRISEKDRQSEMGLAYLNFADVRDQNHVFREMAGYLRRDLTVTGIERPTRMAGVYVSAEFFDLTGIHPLTGRVFTHDEDTPSADPVAIVTAGM